MNQPSERQRFATALDTLVEHIRNDRSVLAAMLCGSLSHDTVWEQSDIDLVLVTIDDRTITAGSIALNADGVNVHACLLPRATFRGLVEGAIQNSFMHSLLTKGRLLYSHDDTIAVLCERLGELGARDRQIQLLRAATQALGSIAKAHKWLITRNDLDYTALWILYAATSLAQVEVIDAGLVADREVIPRALTVNPTFFQAVYTDLLNTPKTRAQVEAALAMVDAYVAERAPRVFGAVIDYLREAGEARSCSELENHFIKSFDLSGVTTTCEYLAEVGLIHKVSVPAKLTRKSNLEVEGLAFVYLGNSQHP